MGQMRIRSIAAGVVLTTSVSIAAFAGGAPANSAPSATQSQSGVDGTFSAVMMVHTSSSAFGELPGVKPWNGGRNNGISYRYRSIPCTGNAPVNNISSDLPSYGTRVANSRAPSSMRAHPFAFTVRKNKKTRRWEMVGSVKFIVCKLGPGPTPQNDPVPDENKPKIIVGFRAEFTRMTSEALRFAGRFRIEGGTQRYEDLTGSGQIAGYLMCFAPEGCSQNGNRYLDGQFVMNGNYSDPTPQLAG